MSAINCEQGLAYGDVVRRVTDLIPLLRKNSQQAEVDRQVPEENIEGLKAAGAMRASTPRRYGGLELDPVQLLHVMEVVSRGCGNTGWVLLAYWIADYYLNYFPRQAQDDFYASASPDVVGASILNPGGVLTPVEGGYRLSGKWPFNTGCGWAQWDMLSCIVKGPEGSPPRFLIALLPMSELTIVRDWNPSALAATGSDTSTAENVFVPSHRVASLPDALAGKATLIGGSESSVKAGPDSSLQACTLYQLIFSSAIGTPVGMAQNAMDVFLARLPGRKVTYTKWLHSEYPVTHVQLGDAQVHLDTARLVALNIAERVRDAGKTSAPLSIKDRVEINAMTAQVVRLSRAAIDLLNSMSGASSIQQDLPLQRIFRDMEGLALHAAMALNTNLEVFGRVLAGNDPGTPFF